jgi:general secretion pathway protein G
MPSKPLVHPDRRPGRTGEVNPWLILLLIVAVVFGTPIILALVLFFVASDTKNAQARLESAHHDLAMFRDALASFHADMGRFPSTVEGLNALIAPPADGSTKWRQYLQVVRPDPWGNPYRYYHTGIPHYPDGYRILSVGPDGKENTADEVALSAGAPATAPTATPSGPRNARQVD